MAAVRLRALGEDEMTAAVGAIHLARRLEVEINDRMAERAAITGDRGSINGKGFAGLHHASMARG